MKNILLTLAATAALLVGGMTFADTVEARPRGWGRTWGGGYYGGYYRPYYRAYPTYGYRAYPSYSYRYGYSGYYGGYYGPRYYRSPSYYGSGFYFSTPRAGFYFY